MSLVFEVQYLFCYIVFYIAVKWLVALFFRCPLFRCPLFRCPNFRLPFYPRLHGCCLFSYDAFFRCPIFRLPNFPLPLFSRLFPLPFIRECTPHHQKIEIWHKGRLGVMMLPGRWIRACAETARDTTLDDEIYSGVNILIGNFAYAGGGKIP